MKKYLIICSSILLGLSTMAQSFEKGQVTIDLSFAPLIGVDQHTFLNGEETGTGTKDVQFSGIRLDAGYALGGKVSLGLLLRNSRSKIARSAVPTSRAHHWSMGLEGRYHILNKENYNVYGGLGLGFNFFNFDDQEEFGDGQSGFLGSVAVGGHYYFTDKVGLSLRLGIGQRYFRSEHSIQGQTTELETTFSGLETAIGLSVKL